MRTPRSPKKTNSPIGIDAQIKALKIKKLGLEKVAQLIEKYQLTLDDLKTMFSAKLPEKPVKTRKSSKLAGKKAAVKYRDSNGNKWSGRGRLPTWLVEAEKTGKKRDEFLVK
jgi:DNA-binding protein H-NS